MELTTSTIFWKDHSEMIVWLSNEDTIELVKTFVEGTKDIVNVRNYIDGQADGFMTHIEIEQIKCIIEGYAKIRVRR